MRTLRAGHTLVVRVCMGKEAMRTRSGPRGLLLRQPWVDRILDGSKSWELRAHATRKRGTIFLVDVSGEITEEILSQLAAVENVIQVQATRRGQ